MYEGANPMTNDDTIKIYFKTTITMSEREDSDTATITVNTTVYDCKGNIEGNEDLIKFIIPLAADAANDASTSGMATAVEQAGHTALIATNTKDTGQ